jgi:hypothetical protein
MRELEVDGGEQQHRGDAQQSQRAQGSGVALVVAPEETLESGIGESQAA